MRTRSGSTPSSDQLETLDDVFDANNYEGTKIADTLYPDVKAPGTFDGKFVAMNYVHDGLRHLVLRQRCSSRTAGPRRRPGTRRIALGAKAKAKGKYLLVWGKEAATYYQTMAVDSAIKEGGDEVRLALENLKPKCWSLPQIQGVFKALGEMVKNGYFVPGGAGTQFTAAQAKWSNDQQAMLYPSGGWIENEMKDATKSGFKMTGAPEPTVTSSPTMPYAALRSRCGRAVHRAVPGRRTSPAARRSCGRCCRRRPRPTSPRPGSRRRSSRALVPADGFGSTALVSQTKMLDAAGSNIFNYQFVDYYGMNTDQLVLWNSFLSGQLDVAGLTSACRTSPTRSPTTRR